MKIVIKQKDIKRHNPMSAALNSTLYRTKRVMDPNKKAYDRKKVKFDV